MQFRMSKIPSFSTCPYPHHASCYQALRMTQQLVQETPLAALALARAPLFSREMALCALVSRDETRHVVATRCRPLQLQSEGNLLQHADLCHGTMSGRNWWTHFTVALHCCTENLYPQTWWGGCSNVLPLLLRTIQPDTTIVCILLLIKVDLV